MKQLKNLASRAPLAFGLAVTLAFIATLVVIAVIANRWPPESERWYIAATSGRVLAIMMLLAFLGRLGWLHPAGFLQAGRWQTWLITILLTVYALAASTYALTGRLSLDFIEHPLPTSAALFILVHALLEEVVFRGLILVALVKAWGSTTNGLLRSILASSLVFAAYHVVNILGGNALSLVLWQMVGAVFLGILLAGMLLSGGSLYPLVVLHGLANLVAFLNLDLNPAAASDPTAWLLQSLLMIPLGVAGLAMLRGIPDQSLVVAPQG